MQSCPLQAASSLLRAPKPNVQAEAAALAVAVRRPMQRMPDLLGHFGTLDTACSSSGQSPSARDSHCEPGLQVLLGIQLTAWL